MFGHNSSQSTSLWISVNITEIGPKPLIMVFQDKEQNQVTSCVHSKISSQFLAE